MDILLVCTGNTCRSPMAAALLGARLAEAGVAATVHSAGTLFDGRPATDHGVACMAERGLDTSGHRSRKVTAALVRRPDLILGMARQHVREVVALAPDAWPRTFTLKELVRRGEQQGPRRPGQALGDWLGEVAGGRRASDLMGDSRDDDVADPIGGPKQAYDHTAQELEGLTERLAKLLVGA